MSRVQFPIPNQWRPTFGFFENNPRFRAVRQNETGANSAVVIYEELFSDNTTRKIAVKKAVNFINEESLRNEIQYIEVRIKHRKGGRS